MKEKNIFWKRIRSIKNSAAVLSVLFGVIGVPLSFWFGHSLEVIGVLLAFLSVDALLARIDTLSNIEDNLKSTSSAVLDIKNAVEKVEMDVITEDDRISEMVFEITGRVQVRNVFILSSGLTTRQGMIAKLLQKGVHVQALMQDPATALDKKDKDRIKTALDWIQHHNQYIQSGLFDARYHINISAVRVIMVTEAESDVKHIFLSWYHYENKNSKVLGDTNPTIYCTTLSKEGEKIYKWLSTVIEKELRESRKIVFKKAERKKK